MVVTRKGFLQIVVSSVGASALGLTACGDDEGSGGAGGTASTTTGTGSTSGTKSSSTATGNTTTTGSTTTTNTSSSANSTTGGMLTCDSNIGTNHPQGAHSIEFSVDDVTAGVDKTYDITGESLHMHSVTITAADFATLAQGGSVTKTSTSGSMHTHEVTITCTL